MPEGRSHWDKYDKRYMRGTCIPPQATDITFDTYETFMNYSDSAQCRVSKKDFLAFAEKKGWKLCSDSYVFNVRTGKPGPDFVWCLLDKFKGPFPAKYLSYNYIYENNGGMVVFYDEEHELMYYSDSLR